MGKGAATREAVITEASSQAALLGLDGISIGGLAGALGLSKSGLFAHFKSKEAMQLAVLDAASARFADAVLRPALALPAGAGQVRRLFGAYLDWIADGGGAGGCVFVTAVQEFDDRPGLVREWLAQSQAEWRGLVAKVGDAAGLDGAQLAFEFVGAALSYQHALKLLHDPEARAMAERALDGMVSKLVR